LSSFGALQTVRALAAKNPSERLPLYTVEKVTDNKVGGGGEGGDCARSPKRGGGK